ncbi:phosphoribosylpyrophosphate synthetase [Siphonobacter sp. BAB-5385]|uniref:ribose-phosphate diphosphokinase n=1 Tax=Siphonobacter sp. BAB-5385 TaxID=1864822 RepID=UPI000B9EE6B5|nr:ribose-phosphate diphosphokinase [Siphonobacter sp. BAB-5385]OZI07255.1 phosphoribosylpyrophosphate synthetase [Siphonobacter sp. BAB-5385]
MKVINLEPTFQPYGPGLAYEAFTFNGGEPHIRIQEPVAGADVQVTTRIQSFQDMGLLLVAVDALRRAGVQNLYLFLPYFPGARQDRCTQVGEALTVKIYADLINALQFKEVQIFDPHSDVTPALLQNVKVISNQTFAQICIASLSDYLLISPDAGALKKTVALAQRLGVDYVECSKKRNTLTGQLSDVRVYADDLQGQTCVVVDDICDGGATFLQLAQALRQHGAGSLVLIVSHGIFSRGFTALATYYDQIFSTDSFQTLSSDALTQIHLSPALF